MKITAIINEKSPRAAEWQKVFGTNEVAIHGWLPTNANVLGEIREVYLLNLKSLTKEQFERLILHISEKFNESVEFIKHELPKVGVPILAEDLIITCDTPFFL